MKPNRIPLKLNKDGLSNALINVNIESIYQTSYLVDKLLEGVSQNEDIEKFQIVPDNKSGGLMLVNSKYRIQLLDKIVSFNFVQGYTGWTEYKNFISTILDALNKCVSYKSVSLRYISGFEDISLFDNLDGIIKLNQLPPFYGTEFHFGFNVKDGNNKGVVDVRITDKLPFASNKAMSVMDITLGSSIDCKSLDVVIEQIEFLHKHEKNIFFLLLKEEFVNTLGPIYE